MSYEGEKFLLKLYQDLDKQDGVLIAEKRSGENSGNKYELLRKYLERLERQEKVFDGEHQELEKFLKNRYYEKYVIKEEDIPASYWELQKKIALERGYGHIEYTDELMHKEATTIIENQKKSLDKWLNYLMKENTSYPMWARYWAFQGMLKLGKYDKEKHCFSRRSKGTVSPFVELNAEALAHTIRTVQNYYEGQDIKDDELKQLIESGNFGKIYSYNIWKLIEEEKENNKDKLDTNDGVWKVFTEGQEKDLIKLLEGKGTGWCIAEEETAKDYLEKGNMHIYFTKDKKGKYTMPRVCIRQEYDEIAEVRGIAEDQNMEEEMLDITDKKLDKFEDKELYKKKVRDMKKLTELYEKSKKGQKLTNDEFRFLLGNEIEGFGWEEDPRIHEILQKNVLTDKKLVLEFSKNEDVLGYASEELKNDKETVLQVIKSNSDRHVFKGASEELRNDRETVLEAVKRNGLALEFVSEELRNDREIVLEAIKNDGLALCYASEELKNDKKVVLEAMKNDSFAVRWAGEELLNDREFILAVVKENRYALEYASDELQNDKKFVLAAVKERGSSALEYASKELLNDREFVLAAIKEDFSSLKYASEELRNDREFVLAAIKEDFSSLKYASEELRNDKKFVLAAIKEKPYALEYASDELQNDKEFILAAAKDNPVIMKQLWRLDNELRELRNDREFVMKAVLENPDTFEYIGKKFKNDREVVLEAVKKKVQLLEYASEELKNDKEFMSEVDRLYDEYHNDDDNKRKSL